MNLRKLAVLAGAFGLLLWPAWASAQTVSFREEVAPLLVRRCLGCHHEQKFKGEFRLHTFAALLKSGESGQPSITPGQPAQSYLLELVSSDDPAGRMPKEGGKLSEAEIDVLRRWIAQGAKFDGPDPQASLVNAVVWRHPQPPAAYSRGFPVTALAFRPDGQELAVGGQHEITLWNPAEGKLLRRISGLAERTYALAYSGDGQWLAAASGTPSQLGEVRLFNAADGALVRVVGGMSDCALGVQFSPDGRRIAACGADNVARVYSLEGKEELTIRDHSDWVTGIAFSLDGQKLVTASRDKTCKVFSAQTGELITTYTGHGEQVYAVALHPDGKLAISAGADMKIHYWLADNPGYADADMKKPKQHQVATLSGFTGPIHALAAVGGNLFACSADKSARQFDAEKRSPLKTFAGHADWLHALAVHEATGRLATGSLDGQVRIWNTAAKSDQEMAVSAFWAAPGIMPNEAAHPAPDAGPPASNTVSGEQVRFSRHVVPVFSRLGCNAGLCHGSVHGKKGFRLALFGIDPARDHLALNREFGGRRLNLLAPERSLLLRKATGEITHEGGQRTTTDSPEYRILRDWIAAGAALDNVADSEVLQLRIEPRTQTIPPGANYTLQVQADFADGTTADVTALCTFEAVNSDVARVDSRGQVTATGVGDTALVVRYRSLPVVAMLAVPGPALGQFPQVAEHNDIDRHVLAKLRSLNLNPAPLCDDATFLRRASLDVTGALPAPEEVRAFLKDADPDKRNKKIGELLERPGFAAVWATKFCDLLRPTGFDAKQGLTEAAEARRFYLWLRARVAENLPYDQLAERILTATSRQGDSAETWIAEVRRWSEENAALQPPLEAYAQRQTLDLYWQRTDAAGVKGTLQVAHAFLGLRLECAQCHRHPSDVWKQDDLLSFANFFMRVSSPGAKPAAEVAAQADMLAGEIKMLKDQSKELGDKAKQKDLPKPEADQLKAEAARLADRAKGLENVGKRLKGTEVFHETKSTSFATVTSPLGSQTSREFRLLGEKEPVVVAADQDPRLLVASWLRRPDNPFFARAIVNRVWAHYFGRGLVDPPDQLSPLNPPSHPALLDQLCADFIRGGYDLRRLHRTILASRTYQASPQTDATNRADKANYAAFPIRRLPAEVLVDAINAVTGGVETYPPELFLPPAAKAVEVAGGSAGSKQNASLDYALRIFGRPERRTDVQCDCERDSTSTIVQTLYLANHPRIVAKVYGPESQAARLAKDFPDQAQRVEQLYLAALGRFPTSAEQERCVAYLVASSTAEEGTADLLWSLLNTREFLLQH